MMESKSLGDSISLRLIIIGVLVLLLLIPSAMITSLVHEREYRKAEAIEEVTSKWAEEQTIGGPVITVPYEKTSLDSDGKMRSYTDYAHFLPEELRINVKLSPQIRYRGIYKVVLYNAAINCSGFFSFADLANLNLSPAKINWHEAFASLNIPDMRGIKENVFLDWDGRRLFLGFSVELSCRQIFGSQTILCHASANQQ